MTEEKLITEAFLAVSNVMEQCTKVRGDRRIEQALRLLVELKNEHVPKKARPTVINAQFVPPAYHELLSAYHDRKDEIVKIKEEKKWAHDQLTEILNEIEAKQLAYTPARNVYVDDLYMRIRTIRNSLGEGND